MTFNDLLKQYRLREKKANDKDNDAAKRVLIEYSKEYVLLHPFTGNYIDDLLYNYFLLKNTQNGKILENIMNKYKFNYSMSIHNVIYYLLGMEQDLSILNTDPLAWPGINNIEEENGIYRLNTLFGEIRVSKASQVFKKSNSAYIFSKPLIGQCHARCYDFIRENREDYHVVLSYMPNFFCGGHFHTYLESDTSVLDIAANSYYSLKEDSSRILNGQIIKKVDYREIERIYSVLYKRMPQLKNMDNSKLLTLSLYYDYKNMKK